MSVDRGACILVFGVSGVGKTSACEEFIRHNPRWIHLKASTLLSDATGHDPETLRTSSSDAIQFNQGLLAGALARARTGRETNSVLLDAHGVIDNEGGLVPVPVAAIAALEPDGMILLEIEPKKLAERRARDARMRPSRSEEELTKELQLERETVTNYSGSLRLPLACGVPVANFTLDPLVETIMSSIGPRKASPE